jgi:hypothetical protein
LLAQRRIQQMANPTMMTIAETMVVAAIMRLLFLVELPFKSENPTVLFNNDDSDLQVLESGEPQRLMLPK